MSRPTARRPARTAPARLKVHQPHRDPAPAWLVQKWPIWRVAGHPVAVRIWTAEEWAREADRPPDALRHPSGCWAALRMA